MASEISWLGRNAAECKVVTGGSGFEPGTLSWSVSSYSE